MRLRERARSLRKAMTPEEVKLWVQLQNLNRLGRDKMSIMIWFILSLDG